MEPTRGVFVANRLRAMGSLMEVTTIQPVPFFPGLRALPGWVRDDLGARTVAPTFYFPGVLKHLDATWFARAIKPPLSSLHNNGRLDLIDAHFGFPDGAAALRVARELGVPGVVTLRGVEKEQVNTTLIGRELRDTLRRADGCICVSQSLAQIALRNGAPEYSLAVIPNGVDDSLFNMRPGPSTRAQMNFPSDRPIVVAVGHVNPTKQYHLLVHALTNRSVRRLNPLLLIVGSTLRDRRYTRMLTALVHELGLSADVMFTGEQPPVLVAAYLKVADCFVSVSRREGCCNALLEALACGVPVIATAVGDNALFINQQSGRLVEAIPGAIAHAVADSLDASRQGGDGMVRPACVNDWSQVADEVLDFFHRILGSPRSAALLA